MLIGRSVEDFNCLFCCRQGDPGSTRYFLSLGDNLFRIFGGDRIKGLMSTFGVADLPIESRMLTNALDEAQRKVGGCSPLSVSIGAHLWWPSMGSRCFASFMGSAATPPSPSMVS